MISESSEGRYAQLQRAFTGELGDVYTGYTLAGTPGKVKIRPLSYLTLYLVEGSAEIDFVNIRDDELDEYGAAHEVQQYELMPGEAAGPYVVVLLNGNATLAALEEAADTDALVRAQQALEPLGLPAAFVAFCELVTDGSRRTMFWYPAMLVPPDRLYRAYRKRVARAYEL